MQSKYKKTASQEIATISAAVYLVYLKHIPAALRIARSHWHHESEAEAAKLNSEIKYLPPEWCTVKKAEEKGSVT